MCAKHLDGAQAIHGRHSDVEEHEVWSERAHPLDGLEPVRRLADEDRVEVAREKPPKLVTRVGLVVGDEYAQRVCHATPSAGTNNESSSSSTDGSIGN